MSKYLQETETDLWAAQDGDSDDDWETGGDTDYVNEATEAEQRRGGTKDRADKLLEEKKDMKISDVRAHAKKQDKQTTNERFKNKGGYYGGSTTKASIGSEAAHNYNLVKDESKGPKAGRRTNVQHGWKGRTKGKAVKRKAGGGKWARKGKGKRKGKKGGKKGPRKKGAKKGAKFAGGNRAPPKPSGPSVAELARKREEEAHAAKREEDARRAKQDEDRRAREQAKRDAQAAQDAAFEEEEAALASAYEAEEEEAAADAAYAAEEEEAAADAAYAAEEEEAAADAAYAEEEAAADAAYAEEEAAYEAEEAAYLEEEAAYEEEEAYPEEEAYEEEAYEEEAYEEEAYEEEAYEEGYEEGYDEEGYEEEGAYEQCTAVGDWQGETEGDISFMTGDILTITDRVSDPEGWWSGYTEAGVQGDFPSTYVELN